MKESIFVQGCKKLNVLQKIMSDEKVSIMNVITTPGSHLDKQNLQNALVQKYSVTFFLST